MPPTHTTTNPSHEKSLDSSESAGRFVLYARKSTESEDRQVQSLDDQMALAHKMADENGLTIVCSISEAHSAKAQGTRKGFTDLIAWINSGKADGILCWHPDRLARNAVDGGWIMDLLDRGKLQHLLFTSGHHFDNTPESKFMLSMVFGQAKYQVDKLSKDVTRGMVSKRERGGFPHRAPEGWKNIHLDGTGVRTIVVDKERFKLLRQAIDLILSNTLVPAQALYTLNNLWGYRSRPTKKRASLPMTRTAFYEMLSNPFIMGMCRCKGDLYQGTHTPMATPDEFSQLQATLSRREKHRTTLTEISITSTVTRMEETKSVAHSDTSTRFLRHSYAFTGLFRCARCGIGMITATCAKGNVYYHCSNPKGICDRKGLREISLVNEISPYLSAVHLSENLGGQLMGLVERHLREQGVVSQERNKETLTRFEAALGEVEGQKQKLRSLLLREVLNESEYANEKARLTHEEAIRRAQIKSHGRGTGDTERLLEAARKAVTFVTTAPIVFHRAAPEEQRQMVRYLSGSVLLDGSHPRPRLDTSRTGKNVLLKPHPHLAPFLVYGASKKSVEPLKSGSGKQKTGSYVPAFRFGGPEERLSELASGLCREIENLCFAPHLLLDRWTYRRKTHTNFYQGE